MVFRACKHILRDLIHELQPEHVPCAISHFLNCLLGTGSNASPTATYHPMELSVEHEPAYVSLNPASTRLEIVKVVKTRFRWTLDEAYLTVGLKKLQFLRELAMRFAFQLLQRDYLFEREVEKDSDDDKENRHPKENEKAKKKKASSVPRNATFEPSDVLTLVPIVRCTAPSVGYFMSIYKLANGRRSPSRKRSSRQVARRSTAATSTSVSSSFSNPSSCTRISIPSFTPRSPRHTTSTRRRCTSWPG